jgi:hypothetical protein
MNKRFYYFIFSVISLLIGTSIYYYFQKDTLVYESYLGIVKNNNNNNKQSYLINWLPDLCWEISLLFMLSTVWGNWRQVPNSIKLLTLSLIIGTELLQMQKLLPGTGDIKDILVYFIGFSIFTLLFKNIDQKRTYEKLD